MRRFTTSTLLTITILAASAVPAFAKHTIAADEDAQTQSALWLSNLENWEQTYEAGVTSDDANTVKVQDIDVTVTPTDIYIIKWYTGE